MKRTVVAICLVAGSGIAAVITPDSFGGPYCLSAAFGPAACSISDEYKAGGLLFSQMGVGTAVFRDPPNAWGGIDVFNYVNLLAPVNAAIVMPGTTNPGVTGYIAVEAGIAGPGNLLLTVYDINGVVLGTRVNGLDGTGPNSRHLIILSVPGIRSFSVSTSRSDLFGVNWIDLGEITPAPAGVIPEPVSLLLVASGLAVLGLRRLRQ